MEAWSRETGISAETIRTRLKKGWAPDRILQKATPISTLTFKGEELTIRQWASRLGLSYHLIRDRLKRGWSTEEALSTNKRTNRFH